MSFSSVASRFKAATALGALAVALAASPQAALAAEACGPIPINGAITCNIADGPFNEGIAYYYGDTLRVNLEEGLNIDADAGNWGIALHSGGGSVILNGEGVNVKAEGNTAVTLNAMESVTATIGDVEVSGDYADAVQAFAAYGNVNLNVGNITATGDYANGIIAESAYGNVSINVGDITTEGFQADPIVAFAGQGDIDIKAGDIKATGDLIWGVTAFSGSYTYEDGTHTGNTSIDVASIEISGDYGVGAYVVSYGDANVKIGDIKMDGDLSTGVAVLVPPVDGIPEGSGNVSVELGNVEMTGEQSNIATVLSTVGTASLKIGTGSTVDGVGVSVNGRHGAYVEAGKINVEGTFAHAIGAFSYLGDVAVKSGEVSTNGYYAKGIVAEAYRGDVIIEAGKVTTLGHWSHGIQAFGGTATVTVAGPVSTVGDESFGLLVGSVKGDAVVRSGGAITTSGDYSHGMWVVGRYGTADIKAAGKVSTSGNYAHGIHANSEDGQIKVIAGEVETSGDYSNGINARSRYVELCLGCEPEGGYKELGDGWTANIDITAESVKVSGVGSIGISARGLGVATIDVARVSSEKSYAIETNMIGNTNIKVRNSAISTEGTAILAEGHDAFVTVASGATVKGGVDGIVIKAVGDRCTQRPEPYAENPCPNPGSLDPYPDPEPLPEIAGFGTVDNAGTISGGTGYAVRVENGTLTLNNSGTILGAVLLGSGNDVINNSGNFVVTKDSDFGLGNDTFKNSGTLTFGNSTVLAGGEAAEFTMVGLEKFENAGLVELRNGVAGDVLTLPSAYVGNGGRLGLDVNFATGDVDKLVVAGAATGTTELVLNIEGGSARLSDTIVAPLVEVGAGSAAGAFKLSEDSANIGFIHYELAFDDGSYILSADAGSGAFRQLNALEGLSNNWYASANAIRSNIAANRDDHWAHVTGRHGLWGQFQTGKIKRDVRENAVAFDYEQDRTGFQIGYDFAGSDNVRFGVTAGYGTSDLDSKVVKEKVSYDTLNFGAYASITTGNLFASLLAKYDKQDVEFRSAEVGFEADADGTSWGVELEGGAHFATGNFFIEPVASIALTSTDLDDISALDQTLEFDAAGGARGKLGVRLGGHGGALRYYASAKAVRDFGGRNSVTLVSGDEKSELKADHLDTFFEGALGASYTFKGIEAFVEGQADRGNQYDNLEGRVGVRFKL